MRNKMTEEQKQLLLKDLCARLPYGVLCKLKNEILPLKDVFIEGVVGNKGQLGFGTNKYGKIFQEIDEIKPYLRPMSSMTEDEILELKELCTIYIPSQSPNIAFEDYGIMVLTHHFVDDYVSFKLNMKAIDWLNAHHFDFRNLIKLGLALEAHEGMYNTKE